MKYWWVNHKQTFKEEFLGGYIWSPVKNRNDSTNKSYSNLTLTNVGDIIFSYSDTLIKAIGIVRKGYINSMIPDEFGNRGEQWDKNGYLVEVDWTKLNNPFRPKDSIQIIAELLPNKYSPIQKNGNGNQGIYLAEIGSKLARELINLININNSYLIPSLDEIEERREEEEEIANIQKSNRSATQKQRLINARLGQGDFRKEVVKKETQCRLTGVSDLSFLIASHIRPWRDSNDEEKLDGDNGLLLSPHIDRLFDKGWISFTNDGKLLIYGEANEVLKRWNISVKNVGKFNTKQQVYLKYHRENIFKDKEFTITA